MEIMFPKFAGIRVIPAHAGGVRRLKNQPSPADSPSMGHPQRIHTYDDELHERRRQLAIVRPPIDFEAERLKRLVEKARDTRDP
jgi:hypothetical protein